MHSRFTPGEAREIAEELEIERLRRVAAEENRTIIRLEARVAELEAKILDSGRPIPGCPECSGTGWFSPTPVKDDGWPCFVCYPRPSALGGEEATE